MCQKLYKYITHKNPIHIQNDHGKLDVCLHGLNKRMMQLNISAHKYRSQKEQNKYILGEGFLQI